MSNKYANQAVLTHDKRRGSLGIREKSLHELKKIIHENFY